MPHGVTIDCIWRMFGQISLNTQGGGGSETFEITDPNTQFCAIKPYHLNRISPGGCVFTDTNNISLLELQTCFRENPCLIGVLAFTPNNINNFELNNTNKNEIYNSIVSCVSSQKNPDSENLKNYCDFGNVPIYNNKTNLIECYNTGFD